MTGYISKGQVRACCALGIIALGCAATPAMAQEIVENINIPAETPLLTYRLVDAQRDQSRDPFAGLSVDAPPDAELPVDDFASLDKSTCYTGPDGLRSCILVKESSVQAGVLYYMVGPGTIPWQAQTFVQSVQGDWRRQHWCGGVLIEKNWLLTAAHCTRDGNGAMKDVRVRLGAFDLTTGDGALYRIDRVIVHADYRRGSKPHDIALLHIVPEAQRGRRANVYKVAPIPILGPRADLRIGTPVHTTGWGRTSYRGPLRDTLGETQLRLVANDRCKAVYGSRFSDRALCAYEEGTDSCEGDSGGPLTIGHEPQTRRLIGIVSFGRGCAERGIPGVYTRVDAYYDWIEEGKKQRAPYMRLPDPRSRR